MNNVTLIGRLVKDAELKYIPGSGKAVSSFTIAVDKYSDGAKAVDYIPVIAWEKKAENLVTYTHKGSQIAVSGRLQQRSYQAKDGTTRYVLEVVANEIQFLDKKEKGTQENKGSSLNNSFNDGMEEIEDTSDIPF